MRPFTHIHAPDISTHTRPHTRPHARPHTRLLLGSSSIIMFLFYYYVPREEACHV